MSTSIIQKWSDNDDQMFKDLYVKYGVQHCADYFNKSRNAVIKRAKKLGVQYGKVKPHFQKENLEVLVKRSKNISDVIRNMDLTAAGGNHGIIKKYILKYGIDTSHFVFHDIERLKAMQTRNTTPLEEVLVENSSYSRTALKERLYKEGIKKRQCELCGQGEEWNGRRMALILDHVNGVNNDNREENLRIVCPNCNATLDTHAGKKNAKPRTVRCCSDCNKPVSPNAKWCTSCAKKHYGTRKKRLGKSCPDCGVSIVDKSDHCRTCSKKHYGPEGHLKRRKVKERPSREQLLKDIATLNYVGTGKKYGVSDNAIRKWIHQL